MISLKSTWEIDIMREAGRIVAQALDLAESLTQPGITTAEIDADVEDFVRKQGAIPAFKGYRGFPATICASVNEEVVHGIPGKRKLKEGDIFSIDMGVRLKNYYADAARTVPVGKISPEAVALIHTCRESLELAIQNAKPFDRLYKISSSIQKYVEARGYTVVENYVGHGIGRQLHEEPQVPNYVSPFFSGLNLILKPGMVLAIEPMVNLGSKDVETLSDGWTVVTKDRKLSSHFEHSVAFHEDRVEVLTVSHA